MPSAAILIASLLANLPTNVAAAATVSVAVIPHSATASTAVSIRAAGGVSDVHRTVKVKVKVSVCVVLRAARARMNLIRNERASLERAGELDSGQLHRAVANWTGRAARVLRIRVEIIGRITVQWRRRDRGINKR